MTDLRPLIEQVAKICGWELGSMRTTWHDGVYGAAPYGGDHLADHGIVVLLERLLVAGWEFSRYTKGGSYCAEHRLGSKDVEIRGKTLAECLLMATIAMEQHK